LTTSLKGTKSAFLSIRPCGRDLFELVPRKGLVVDLQKAKKALIRAGFSVTEVSEMALTASGSHEISLFPNGKLIVFPVKTNSEAERVGDGLLDALMSEDGCVSETTR
jgi:hypothetical protein